MNEFQAAMGICNLRHLFEEVSNDGYKYTLDEIFAKLAEQGITARKYFYPLTSDFECYWDFRPQGARKRSLRVTLQQAS